MSIDRDAIERKLSRVLSSGFRNELDRLMEYLGDPPDLRNVPPSYWSSGWKDIQRQVEPILVDTFVESAMALPGIGIAVEWDLINSEASNWARTNLESLLQKIFNRNYEHLNELIPRYFEDNWTVRDLARELERYYSPVRAEMIAVTETTRSVVQGERAAVWQMQKESGLRMVPIWLTARDDRVCEICGPKHKQPIVGSDFPPAHPRCRCGVAYEYPKEGR